MIRRYISVPDISIPLKPSSKLGVILGASIGIAVGLAFVIVAIYLCRRRRRRVEGTHKTSEYESVKLTKILISPSYRTRTRADFSYVTLDSFYRADSFYVTHSE